jgi:hypothetical protein
MLFFISRFLLEEIMTKFGEMETSLDSQESVKQNIRLKSQGSDEGGGKCGC